MPNSGKCKDNLNFQNPYNFNYDDLVQLIFFPSFVIFSEKKAKLLWFQVCSCSFEHFIYAVGKTDSWKHTQLGSILLPCFTIFYESVFTISIFMLRWFVRYRSSKMPGWSLRSTKCPWGIHGGIHGVYGVPRGNDFEIITQQFRDTSLEYT